MGGKSSIKALPKAIREELDRLLAGGVVTLDEIVAHLRELGHPRSRSAVGRYKKEIDAIAADVRRSREIAEALTERFGDAPEKTVARGNIELMHSVVMKMIASDGGLVTLDPREAMFAATALQKLAQAEKLDTDRILKIRSEVARKAAKQAEKSIKDAGKKHGFTLPAEALKAIREQVYGIVEAP